MFKSLYDFNLCKKHFPFGYSQNSEYSKTFIFLLIFLSPVPRVVPDQRSVFLKCLEETLLKLSKYNQLTLCPHS